MSLSDRPPSYGDFCTFCGERHSSWSAWPRTCSKGHTMYRTVSVVSVLLIPVETSKLVGVRRNIPPKIGEVAFPGGYNDGSDTESETWQRACAREVYEESSGAIVIPEEEITEWLVRSTKNNLCLVFGIARSRPLVWWQDALTHFTPNEETQELVLVDASTPLCFPLHVEAAKRYFDSVEHMDVQMRAIR